MAITPVQPNIETHKPYKDANGTITTDRNVKPLYPQGHLVNDRLVSMPKFFVKDIMYDIKSVKDGLKGTANDHQTGRLNDVGLKLGGVGIATLLAARTTNPIARIMEYAGLGAFLASMSIFPKVAIQAPSRVLHGFDSGIEYIDDQGRKKSMFQDQNYIPFDMYTGETPDSDLDVIGDRLGIPRNIKNRHDLIKEQMRKISIQNNTLWMLTAGFATPVIAALTCFGLEKVLSTGYAKLSNKVYNTTIQKMHEQMQNVIKSTENFETKEIKSNSLSKQVEGILSSYKDKELPKLEFDNLVKIITKDLDANASEGIKEDLTKLLQTEKNGEKSFVISEKSEIINSIKNNIPSRNRSVLEKVFVPSEDELKAILKDEDAITENNIQKIKEGFKNLYTKKINSETSVSKDFLRAYQNEVLERFSENLRSNPSRYISENNMKDIVEFAKILGEFKANDKILDKCKAMKVEHTNGTVIANSYEKFEKTLFEVLNIRFKDLKQMKESPKFAQDILDKKLTELCKNEAKYEEAVSKLAKVMSEMEVNLNGRDLVKSDMVDLINAIENNYNATAKRLSKLGKFKNTIDRMVKEDVSTLSNSVKTKEELFNLLDGMVMDKGLSGLEHVKDSSKGIGSSKNAVITRIVERYQGAENSFRRVLHLFDVYKRPTEGVDLELLKKGKEVLLTATSADHTLKLNTVNNPEYYKNLMYNIWNEKIELATARGLGANNDMASGNVADRFTRYIKRFRDIIGNNNIDFTKPQHILNENDYRRYSKGSKTRMQKFNLVSQSPVDMVKNAASRKYGTQKWLRIVSTIGGITLGVTLLAQLCFGKIKNPYNIQKQVSDDKNNKN